MPQVKRKRNSEVEDYFVLSDSMNVQQPKKIRIQKEFEDMNCTGQHSYAVERNYNCSTGNRSIRSKRVLSEVVNVMKAHRTQFSGWVQHDAGGSKWKVTTQKTNKGDCQLKSNARNCSEKMTSCNYKNCMKMKVGFEDVKNVYDNKLNGSNCNGLHDVLKHPSLLNDTKTKISIQSCRNGSSNSMNADCKGESQKMKSYSSNEKSKSQSGIMDLTNMKNVITLGKLSVNTSESTVGINKKGKTELHEIKTSMNITGGQHNEDAANYEIGVENKSEVQIRVRKHKNEKNVLHVSKKIQSGEEVRGQLDQNFSPFRGEEGSGSEEKDQGTKEVKRKNRKRLKEFVGSMMQKRKVRNEDYEVEKEQIVRERKNMRQLREYEEENDDHVVNEHEVTKNVPQRVDERDAVHLNSINNEEKENEEEDVIRVKKKKIRQLYDSEDENEDHSRNSKQENFSNIGKNRIERKYSTRTHNREEENDHNDAVEVKESTGEEDNSDFSEEESIEEESDEDLKERIKKRMVMQFLDIEAEEGEETEEEYQEEEEDDIEESDEESSIDGVEQFIDSEAKEENFLRRKKRVQIIQSEEDEDDENENSEIKERLEKAMHIMTKLRRIITAGHFKGVPLNKLEGIEQNNKIEKRKYKTNARVWGEKKRSYASDPE